MDLPLASLADLKAELGIADAVVTNDALLLRKLRVASARVESYCQRSFSRATTTEKLRTPGSRFLVLDRGPLIAIGQIVDSNGAVVDAGSYAIDDAKARKVRMNAGEWENTGLRVADFSEATRYPGTEASEYAVTYDAGYITGWQVDPRTSTNVALGSGPPAFFPGLEKSMPADLEEAVIKVAVQGWRSRGRDASVVAESLSRGAQSFGTGNLATLDDVRAGAAGFPVDVVGILDSYARIIQA